MRKIGNLLDALCAAVSALSLICLIGLYFVESIGRQLSMPVPGAQESASLLLSCFIFSAIPLVVRENGNISVGLLVDGYSRLARKAEQCVTVVAEVLLTGLWVYLVYDFANRQARVGQITPQHHIPYAPFIYLGAAFMVIALFFAIERHVSRRSDLNASGEEASHPITGNSE